jgi:hypothetical protein
MSVATIDTKPRSVLAVAGFALAVFAFVISMFFTFGPMTMLAVRGDGEVPIPDLPVMQKLIYWLMYAGPAVLGVGAAILGYTALSNGENRATSDGMAFFAIAIGLLTVIVGAMDMIPMVYPAIEALLSK